MNTMRELLQKEIGRLILEYYDSQSLDCEGLASSAATRALAKIQGVVTSDTLSDFDKVEGIVCIFEEFGLSGGAAHDF